MKFKKFDLEKAKLGAPVCAGNGCPARIICFDRKGSYYPIVALVMYDGEREEVVSFTEKGMRNIVGDPKCILNLYMAPVNKEDKL